MTVLHFGSDEISLIWPNKDNVRDAVALSAWASCEAANLLHSGRIVLSPEEIPLCIEVLTYRWNKLTRKLSQALNYTAAWPDYSLVLPIYRPSVSGAGRWVCVKCCAR